MTLIEVSAENLQNNPKKLKSFLEDIKPAIQNFVWNHLEAIKDLPIVAELQEASMEMYRALDSGHHEAVHTCWLEYKVKFELIKIAYHEAAHAVVGHRLRSKFNRKILLICINYQKAMKLHSEPGFVEFESKDPQNQIEAQALLAGIISGFLNEPCLETENNVLGGESTLIKDKDAGDAKQRDEIITKWFMGTKKARRLVMDEATREATWVGQRDAISALARVLLLEPTLELDEQAAYEFLSNRPELNGT